MIFSGLPFSTLVAIAGIAGGLTIALYILKLRRRPIAVPFSMIWERILRDKEATTLFSRLKRLLSLLLQLILILLLVMALGDPRLSENLVEGRNIVVLVDTSASMKSTDVAPSRLEVAKGKVKELIRGLGGSDRLLIAKMDASTTPLSTMTGEVSDLEKAVDNLVATDTRTDFRRALDFASDSLRGLAKPEIIVVSDGALGDSEDYSRNIDLGDTKVSYLPVGKSGVNVAITQFSVRRYPLDRSRYEVMLEVTNTNDKPAEVELTLLGDGDVVDVTRINLAPNERLPRFYKDLAGASQTLEARIRLQNGKHDDLPADDHAYALMPERHRSRVLVVTTTNTYLEAALLLDEYLDVSIISPKNYPPKDGYDVTIFDRVAPPLAKNGGAALYLNPPEEGCPVKYAKKIKDFGFDTWNRKHPIVRWIALGNIQALKGNTFKPKKRDKVVAASAKGPLLVTGRRKGRRFVVLGFDPRRSDFVLRVAWPLFILNTVNYFVDEDTSYVSSFRTGEVWRIPAPSGAEVAKLETPSGETRLVPIKEGRAIYQGEQAGFYKLRVEGVGAADGADKKTGDEDDVVEMMFAANLVEVDESRIQPAEVLEIGEVRAGAVGTFAAGVRREVWLYLLIAVVLLSSLEWLTYHRRVTV